jgi:hypothetical protein
MTEFNDTRAAESNSNRVTAAEPGGSAFHRELENAATSIVNHLKKGTPNDLNQALIGFRDEILSLEKRGGKDVVANERDFLRALTGQRDELDANNKLNDLGFPKFHLTQDGERLTLSAEIKEKNGTVDSANYHFDWTSFTKKHHHSGNSAELTSSDFMEALQPKLDQSTISEAPRAVPPEAAQKPGVLTGNVKDQQVNISTDESHYPAPKMVYDGNVQAQPHIRYTGHVSVPGDVINISAHDVNLPGAATWINVSGSNLYHSAYGFFEKNDNNAARRSAGPTEIFHLLQVSQYDAANAPGRPVVVRPPGAKWDVELQASPE